MPRYVGNRICCGRQAKLTPALKMVIIQPEPVVRAGIKALQSGRKSVVPGFGNKAMAILTWATPRLLHQSIMVHVMGV